MTLRRIFATLASVLAVLVAFAGLSACSDDNSNSQSVSQAICVDPNTQQRLDDSACGAGDHYYDGNSAMENAAFWYFLTANNGQYRYPGIGQSYNGYGSYYTPSRTTVIYLGGAPSTAGSHKANSGFASAKKQTGNQVKAVVKEQAAAAKAKKTPTPTTTSAKPGTSATKAPTASPTTKATSSPSATKSTPKPSTTTKPSTSATKSTPKSTQSTPKSTTKKQSSGGYNSSKKSTTTKKK